MLFKNVVAIIISEISNYLTNKKFGYLNVGFLLIISLAVFLNFPEGRRGFVTPDTAVVMLKAVIIMLAPINFHFLNRGLISEGILSAEKLYERNNYTYLEIYVAKIFVNFILNFLLLISFLPYILLVVALGSVTFSVIDQYYYMMIFASLTFGWFGIVISGIERSLLRNLVGLYIWLAYMFIIINISYEKYLRVFIPIIGFSVLVLLWKIFNPVNFSKNRDI